MNGENSWVEDLLNLKRTPRSGWFRVGVNRPESVADHSFATGLLAWRIARERGLDAERVLLMALLHDFHEARLGDIPSPAKAALPAGVLVEAEGRIRREQWGTHAPEVVALLEEFEGGESEEARLVRAVDTLELFLQARRYRRAGFTDADEFLSALRGARELGELGDIPWLAEALGDDDGGR